MIMVILNVYLCVNITISINYNGDIKRILVCEE